MDRLIIRKEDTFGMRQPHRAVGGIRGSLTSSSVRIDYVAHTLLALVKELSSHRRSQPLTAQLMGRSVVSACGSE